MTLGGHEIPRCTMRPALFSLFVLFFFFFLYTLPLIFSCTSQACYGRGSYECIQTPDRLALTEATWATKPTALPMAACGAVAAAPSVTIVVASAVRFKSLNLKPSHAMCAYHGPIFLGGVILVHVYTLPTVLLLFLFFFLLQRGSSLHRA